MAAVGRSAASRTAPARWCAATLPFLWLAATLLLPGLAHARSDQPDAAERQVKAAYVSKFASYVEWPPAAFTSSDTPVQIGVLGDDAMAAYVAQLVAGRTANGRPVKVQALQADSSLAGLHILFIGRSINPQLREVLAAVGALPLLTVTDADDALEAGSMINFVTEDGRVRFEVSQKASQPNSVRISARLLAAATRVIVGRQQW